MESSARISVAIDNNAERSTWRGHSVASLAGCLANSQSAIQLLIYIGMYVY